MSLDPLGKTSEAGTAPGKRQSDLQDSTVPNLPTVAVIGFRAWSLGLGLKV